MIVQYILKAHIGKTAQWDHWVRLCGVAQHDITMKLSEDIFWGGEGGKQIVHTKLGNLLIV
jgi:hypothetical protein